MHFSKLIVAFVALTVTSVLATSPVREEGRDLADMRGETEFDALDEGIQMDASPDSPGCDSESEMDSTDDQMPNFSPVKLTSLQLWSARKMICVFGRCLRRHSRRRRCPRGYKPLAYRRCGWRRVRALCCRRFSRFHRRRWANNLNQLEGRSGGEDEVEDDGEDEGEGEDEGAEDGAEISQHKLDGLLDD